MKHLLVLIAFVFGLQTTFAQQDSIYYYKGNFKPATAETATMYKEFKVVDAENFELKIVRKKANDVWGDAIINRIKRINDSIFEIRVFKTHKKRKKVKEKLTKTFTRKYIKNDDNSYSYFEYDDKNYLREAGKTLQLFPVKKDGRIISYYKEKKTDEVIYKNGIYVHDVLFELNGTEFYNNICPLPDTFIVLDKGTLSESMRRQVRKYFNYPLEAKKKRQEGRVIVQFLIDKNLQITSIRIRKSPHRILSKEVISIINKIRFKGKPATVDGKPVKMKFTIPITFKLH